MAWPQDMQTNKSIIVGKSKFWENIKNADVNILKGEIMVNDFFLGFVGHAHTRNEMGIDPNNEIELRTRNNPKEAQRLTEAVLDKLEKDISNAGYTLKDVKLLILYLSYRGETDEKDRLTCERILRVIQRRFEDHNAANQLGLIGHTTAGEIENEDLMLKEVSGIGYNGLSLLALVTNLPIGVARTWGFETEQEALHEGREMAHDAWTDYNQNADLKEHIQKSKTLFVLTQGPIVGGLQSPGKKGFEHFLGEGIADFMGGSREARITNVIGGSSGDGCIAKVFRQFYGRLGKQSEFKILNNEAVCALIPNLSEPSIGLDVTPTRRVGRSYMFHFDREAKPEFMNVKRIGKMGPAELLAKVVYENEARISRKEGRPIVEEKEIFESVSEFEGLPIHPALGKYAFAFPFGNYTPVCPIRVTMKSHIGRQKEIMELAHPVRSHEAAMKGYVAAIDCSKVQKGARNVYNMLRENRGFSEGDVTLIVSCISRRLAEIMAGCKSETEAEILKEALSSTQVMGFLAYGELSFTHLLQEPYHYNFSCWGITLRSKTNGSEERKLRKAVRVRKLKATSEPEPVAIVVSEFLPGRVTTGYADLDNLLFGGIPENYAVILTSPSCDERDLLIKKFLEAGAKEGQITFHVAIEASRVKTLAEEFQSNFYLFICNPQADKIIKSLPNVFKLKGVENLNDINIALASAFRKLDKIPSEPRRACIEIISDVLLQHHAVHTRRWLNALIPELRSNDFTTLAVIDPQMHPPQEFHAIMNLFGGEINIYEKETEGGPRKCLKIKKLANQKYLESELPLKREEPQKRN